MIPQLPEGYMVVHKDGSSVRLQDLPDFKQTALPADPMDWPLPCDVTVGHGTIGKGCSLSTLVLRMKVLYKMATGHDADEVANRTSEQKQALLDAFQAKVDAAFTEYLKQNSTD